MLVHLKEQRGTHQTGAARMKRRVRYLGKQLMDEQYLLIQVYCLLVYEFMPWTLACKVATSS